MANIEVTSSEEYKGITTLFLSNNGTINIPTDYLYRFVEENKLNTENGSNGLTCDPYAKEYTIETPVSDYLDANWDQVCSDYYKYIIKKGVLNGN